MLLAGAMPATAFSEDEPADNQLTAREKADGWQLLFNGRDHTGWKCSNGKPIATPVEDNCLLPYKSGGYLIVHEKPQGDFILKCDVRMDRPYCNSGIFFRVSDLSDPVQSGFEGQVASGLKPNYHSFGAVYDLVPPTKSPLTREDMWDWHTVEIKCQGPKIEIAVDGQLVTQADLDEFDEPGKRPDGSQHKFKGVMKDMARSGHLGFQDHGAKCWYKNVKLLELK
jgi:hypothetical protein